MLDYSSIDKENFKEAIKETALQMNVSDNIIEKDFWVCFTLDFLFSLEEIKGYLTFKGGTSLSKAYKIISRFSEDIDISIERKFFGFEGDTEPLNAGSNKKTKKLIEDLAIKCSKYVKNDLFQLLKSRLEQYFDDDERWNLEIDPNDKDQQTILFFYPTLFETTNQYVKSFVRIEIGARSDHWPVNMRSIISYVGEKFDTFKGKKDVPIKILNAERTFWEKVLILHKFAHYPEDKNVPERQSRHYYDFYRLLKSDAKQKALEDLELLEKVAAHNTVFFRAAWASYDTAKKGTLKIIPSDRVMEFMKDDYHAMSEMFFGEIPKWEMISNELANFENQFNEN